ncbi:stage II sporulation protein D [Clostridium manihotivorum]|uniref:Stage II sporulation protein D n=1 Tax=Clostridium manihotivorum TaxID=2320868 RepID=A0A3R5TEC6_9CLOT|nr:stage II sporulation protein D [Clostridium manihotivorum]QAA31443.1 stage II sporulation protein D [Clostridium manihotivorum]
MKITSRISKKYFLGFGIVFFICFFTPIIISLLAGSNDNFNKNISNIKNFIFDNNQSDHNKQYDFHKIKVYNTETKKTVEMDLEQYVYGVVAAEMPVNFNLEALKAQAVAARTFALTRIVNKCPQANGADICDSTHCQVYIGEAEKKKQWEASKSKDYWDKIVQAVDSTKGQVLSYDGYLVMNPQYFAVSSGKTESSKEVFGSDVPYLVSVDSPGEERATKYKSTVSYTYDKFTTLINDYYKDSGIKKSSLKSQLKILSRTEGGGVNEISVGRTIIKGTDFRKLLSLKSTNFSISFSNGKIAFNCIGYGHGVGLSQWGANAMAGTGASFDKILKHYYTGVDIKRLEDIRVSNKN